MKIILLFLSIFGLSDSRGFELESMWTKPNFVISEYAGDKTVLAKGTLDNKSGMDSLRIPGTKWCGKDARTDSFFGLGGYSTADRCCRQHDLGCNENIPPGKTKYGLQNNRIHPIMHCSCDERFRSCLKMVKSPSAQVIGNLFFNIISVPCFLIIEEQECTNYTWWGKCRSNKISKKAIWRKPIRF